MSEKSESQRFAMEGAWSQAQKAASKSKAKSYEAAKAWVRRKGSVKMQALLSGATGSAASREFRQSLRDLTDPERTRQMHEEHMGAGHYNPKKGHPFPYKGRPKKKRSTSFGERLPKLLQGLEEEDYVVHRGDAYGQPGVWMVVSEDGWRFDLAPVKGRQSGSYQMWALPKGKTEMATMRSHPLYEGRNSFGTQSSAGAKGIIHALSLPYGSVPGSRFARKNAPKTGAGRGYIAHLKQEERDELTPRIKEVLQLAAGAKALSEFYSGRGYGKSGKQYDQDTHKSQKYRAMAKGRLAEGQRMAHDEELAQSYYYRMSKEIEHKLAYRKLDARHIENVIAQTGRKLKSKPTKAYRSNRSHRPMPARCPFTGQFMGSR
jgi:hypothetical protein